MKNSQSYIEIKEKRRQKKKMVRRNVDAQTVIFIFEKVLEGWKTVRIFNTILQKGTIVLKQDVETIATGNCKVYENELDKENFQRYVDLRALVYDYHKKTQKENIAL